MPTSKPPPSAAGAPLPSFRELARQYRSFVQRAAVAFGIGYDEVDDVTQSVLRFLQLRIDSSGVPDNLEGWLLTVTKRVAWQANERALKIRTEEAAVAQATQDEQGPSSEELFLARETVLLVNEVLASMDPLRADVLRRYEMFGESMATIAVAQGIPINTAYNRLRLARADFKAAYRTFQARRSHRPLFMVFCFDRDPLPRAATGMLHVTAAALAILLSGPRAAPTRAAEVEPTAMALVRPTASLPGGGVSDIEQKPPVREQGAPALLVSATASVAAPRRGGSAARAGGALAITRGRSSSALELEGARLALDVADRMASEGHMESAARALRLYQEEAPANPLSGSRRLAEAAIGAERSGATAAR